MAARSGARRCGVALLTLLLSLAVLPAARALPTAAPVERSAGQDDALRLHSSVTTTPRHLVQRSGALGALPVSATVGAPPVRDARAPLAEGLEPLRARQFDPWIDERGPPLPS